MNNMHKTHLHWTKYTNNPNRYIPKIKAWINTHSSTIAQGEDSRERDTGRRSPIHVLTEVDITELQWTSHWSSIGRLR